MPLLNREPNLDHSETSGTPERHLVIRHAHAALDGIQELSPPEGLAAETLKAFVKGTPMKELTATEVKDYRERNGCSMEEAKRGVLRAHAIEIVERAESVADLKEVLIAILKNDI